MKKLFYLLILLILTSCGKISPKGNLTSQTVEVSDFTTMELQGKYRLFFVKSSKNFVEVETYPNIFNNLKIRVQDKNLKITETRPTENIDFYNVTVYGKYSPEKIIASDSVEINISGAIKTDNFSLNLKNNAKFIGALNTRKAEVEMINTSRANFIGTTKNAVLKIADTANVIAPYWILNNVHLDAKNGSYTEINVKDSINGNIQNTAKFLYYNEPIRAFKVDRTARVTTEMLP